MSTNQVQADSLIGLHLPRSLTELRTEAACHLLQVFPESSMAVLFSGDCDEEDHFVVELAIGENCPLQVDEEVTFEAWHSEDLNRFPLSYKGHQVGSLLIEGQESPEQKERAAEILSHFAVAIINIKLNEEALRATDQYCASLQAFEKGVVLFQESDKEAVGARFLSLMSSVLGTQASALFILDKVGDPESALRLSQALGIPEMMLEDLRLEDGSWWPESLLKGAVERFDRKEDGSLPPLAGVIPPAMQSIVALPMRYHGVLAGLYMAFNVDLEDAMSHETLESARRLSELGAALFHRFSLEEAAVRERGLQTQLQIAANIQRRLIPSVAPESKFIECSWQSRPAQFVGGDYLDLVGSESGEVHSVIADVSGHGINSALLMTSFRSNFRSDCNHLEPCALLEKLNREVAHEV
ncbi:MAG: PP2C family protein-serine/threonine phosphatase, partial [Planctomycetota bacterium]